MKHLKDISDWKDCINQVVCGDSLDLLKMIPNNAIDLVLTDPPYGIGASDKKFRSGTAKVIRNDFYGEWDSFTPTQEYFDEIIRISKNQIIWGGNYFPLTPSRCWIIWDKLQPMETYADVELAYTSFDKNIKIYKQFWSGGNAKERREKRFHPTQKPLELMRWCLENYAKEGDLIFDGFAGSFTTARACKDMGFDWIAIDKEEKYCEIGEKRLQQLNLF